MPTELERLISALDRHPPAPREQIAAAAEDMAIAFPPDYEEFLSLANGGDGWVGESFVRLWPVEELRRGNEDYETWEYFPNHVRFATDGATDSFAFDRSVRPATIVNIPLDTIDHDDIRPLAASFVEFLRLLERFDW